MARGFLKTEQREFRAGVYFYLTARMPLAAPKVQVTCSWQILGRYTSTVINFIPAIINIDANNKESSYHLNHMLLFSQYALSHI